MRLRAAQGKLKIEHSIIAGLRPVLERLIQNNPEIQSVVPGVIRPVREARGKIRVRVTTATQTGWKVLAFSAGARQEVFLNTRLRREEVEAAIERALGG